LPEGLGLMGFSIVDSLIVSVFKEPDNYTWWTVRVPTARQVIRGGEFIV
jgi:hypothetical protein